nr:MAG TPA: hypothetical protein [Caudoviricetes sp.]
MYTNSVLISFCYFIWESLVPAGFLSQCTKIYISLCDYNFFLRIYMLVTQFYLCIFKRNFWRFYA